MCVAVQTTMARAPVRIPETKNVFLKGLALRRQKSRKKKESKKARKERQDERKALGDNVYF